MRLFVALDVPSAVRATLSELSAELRKLCPRARWTRLEGVHVTLKFIGEIRDDLVENVRAVLEGIHGFRPIAMQFAGLGFFPSPRRPRVFWAGIHADPALGQLAATIETSLERLGIPAEKRAFQPHLTLARFESPQGAGKLLEAADRIGNREFGHSVASEFYLYRSVLKPGGAEYTRLHAFPFEGDRPS